MTRDLKSRIKPLRAYFTALRRYQLRSGLFSACLRASAVRSFEFFDHAVRYASKDASFFLVPGLRGVTEDIIYLRFISQLQREERETLIAGLTALELQGKLKAQGEFFRVFRPFQPVLRGSVDGAARPQDTVRCIWRAHGWPNLTKVVPPTREIAAKCDPGLLEVVYDFIYRLTSGTVHFNPQVLLRSGWGCVKHKTHKVAFSTSHMDPYYRAFAQIYGGYLLCLYFEFFGRFLKPTAAIQRALIDLRESLFMESRWPEMVTFEEMNLPVPKPSQMPGLVVRAAYTVMFREGFIRRRDGVSPYDEWLQRTPEAGAAEPPR